MLDETDDISDGDSEIADAQSAAADACRPSSRKPVTVTTTFYCRKSILASVILSVVLVSFVGFGVMLTSRKENRGDLQAIDASNLSPSIRPSRAFN